MKSSQQDTIDDYAGKTIFVKNTSIDVDPFDDELLLMNMSTRDVLMLNASGRLLWEALDSFSSRSELEELFLEGLPDMPHAQVIEGVGAVLEALMSRGFVSEMSA